jgi:hypothetical protein
MLILGNHTRASIRDSYVLSNNYYKNCWVLTKAEGHTQNCILFKTSNRGFLIGKKFWFWRHCSKLGDENTLVVVSSWTEVFSAYCWQLFLLFQQHFDVENDEKYRCGCNMKGSRELILSGLKLEELKFCLIFRFISFSVSFLRSIPFSFLLLQNLSWLFWCMNIPWINRYTLKNASQCLWVSSIVICSVLINVLSQIP